MNQVTFLRRRSVITNTIFHKMCFMSVHVYSCKHGGDVNF